MTSEISFATNSVFCAHKSFAFCFKHAHICCNNPNAQLLKVDDVILTGSPLLQTTNLQLSFPPALSHHDKINSPVKSRETVENSVM